MDGAEYAQAARTAIEQLARYVERSARGDGPALSRPALGALTDELDLRRLIRDGGLDAASFGDFLTGYLESTTRLHHPGELAHQVAVPDTPAALADLVHGVINNPMGIYEMGAAAAAAEVAVVEWMLEKAGLGEKGAGVLTHGGSLANLTALLAARARAAPDAWMDGTPGDLALLAPPSAHYSITRAAAILGLGERAVVPLEVDELERIRPDRLEDALQRVRTDGRRPLALVAAACATSTGLHDDLRAVGSFCREHGVWLHVDAAHGASALLSPRHRSLLDGIELADSVVWDAHKMLRTSALCAAVLVRGAEDLAAALHQKASYLFYERDDPAGVDLLGFTIECTKAALGTKLWLNLAWRGERGLGEYVAGRYDATRRFAAQIAARPGFSCPYEPESNILCFSYDPASDRVVEIRDRLLADGDFHISSTEVAGRRLLRIVVTSPATDEATIERLLDAIEAAAQPDSSTDLSRRRSRAMPRRTIAESSGPATA
jgi:L-2,4-diaminobutyrate decarboxylase